MLTSQDKKWLSKAYPDLKPNGHNLSGIIEFTATYNEQSGLFLILGPNIYDDVGGLSLSGKFKVRIDERVRMNLSKLPALFIEEIEQSPDRHFSADSSACLCSPLEEREFLQPEFQLRKYIEELVIPFLFGQIFFSKENRWPWGDYQHGGIGLLQSYFNFDGQITKNFVIEFLSYLKQDRNWPSYRRLLVMTRPSKQICACGSAYILRDCHPEVLKGLARLKADISNLAMNLE